MKKIAIIGSSGQLGTQFVKAYSEKKGIQVTELPHEKIEITDFGNCNEVLSDLKPDIILNTAAFHKVDACEEDQDKAFHINGHGPRNLAQINERLGSVLVHISTDYVFGFEDHTRMIGCREYDDTGPVNIYGKSKLYGEQEVRSLTTRYFICRTSWLFGPGGSRQKGDNFVTKMAKLMEAQSSIQVVNDQTGTPSYTPDVAGQIIRLISTRQFGTYHVSNNNMATWFEYACEIRKLLAFDTEIEPVSSNEFFTKAKRPRFSALDNYNLRLLGMDQMPAWQEALGRYIEEEI